VKEEDKNILIGDNYIAPVTQQFPGLGSAIYILPDQASVAAVYNANQGARSGYNPTNVQNPTQSFGRVSSLPSGEGDTGSVEMFCRAWVRRASCPTTSACSRSRMKWRRSPVRCAVCATAKW